MTAGALGYLIARSTVNNLRARLTRLRNPRYAIALALGLAYIWGVYLRPMDRGRPAPSMFNEGLAPFLPLVALVFVAWTWLFGGDRSALAFSEAEAAMLFPAPVSRRMLVAYKVARSQLAILTTSVLWTILFRRGLSSGEALPRAISLWLLLSTLNLNRLGAALIHASAGAHGVRAARRNFVPIAIFAAIALMVVVPVAAAWGRIAGAASLHEGVGVLGTTLTSPPAGWALWPFHIAIAPVVARPGLPWLVALGPAVALFALMLAWVIRTDSAFEESALEATTAYAKKVAAIRGRRDGTMPVVVTKAGRTLPLRSTGLPAVALLWKNAMWVLRTGQLRGLLVPPLGALLALGVAGRQYEAARLIIGVACLVIGVAMLIFGPATMRNDLRSELLHLSVLKTYPLRGRDVVLAEVASGALPLAVSQTLLALVGLAALAMLREDQVSHALLAGAAIAIPFLLAALNGAMFAIHNALALLFPGWIKLGATGAPGVESLGMGMMTLLLVLFMLVLLLLAPAIAGGVVFVMLRSHAALAVAAAGLASAAALIAETVAFCVMLGGSFDRVEPMQVG